MDPPGGEGQHEEGQAAGLLRPPEVPQRLQGSHVLGKEAGVGTTTKQRNNKILLMGK